MCDNFDDFIDDGFDDGDFDGDDSCEDHYDDGMEDSFDSDPDNGLHQEDNQTDEMSWNEAYWSGVGLGWFYEEGKRKRRRQKELDINNQSDID